MIEVVEHQTRGREHADIVEAARPAVRAQLVAVRMERERDERVEPGRTLLRLAQHDEMLRAFLERLDRAVEHRRVRRDAVPVGDLVYLEPMRRVDLVRAHFLAETRAEDFRTAAVDVVEARFAQRREQVVVRHAVAARHVIEFGGREERELGVRQRFLETAHQRQPVIERELLRIVTADDVDLIEIVARLDRFCEDFIGRHAHDAVPLLDLVDRERTEPAIRVTHVRRVDVAVEDVEDFLPALALFRGLREATERMDVLRREEGDAVFFGERDALLDFVFDRDAGRGR